MEKRMEFLATLPKREGWLDINPQTTTKAIIAFTQVKQEPKVWTQSIDELKNVIKRMRSKSLFNLLRYFSTEDENVRVLLIPIVIIIEDELMTRCSFFENAHSVPRG
jgi:hypothetical protein